MSTEGLNQGDVSPCTYLFRSICVERLGPLVSAGAGVARLGPLVGAAAGVLRDKGEREWGYSADMPGVIVHNKEIKKRFRIGQYKNIYYYSEHNPVQIMSRDNTSA